MAIPFLSDNSGKNAPFTQVESAAIAVTLKNNGNTRLLTTGGGVDITPMGNYGTSSIRVDNLNVNVTGVSSDPMQARKAAIQIKKELAKLDREGLIGTGIRGR